MEKEITKLKSQITKGQKVKVMSLYDLWFAGSYLAIAGNHLTVTKCHLWVIGSHLSVVQSLLSLVQSRLLYKLYECKDYC